MDQDFFLQEKIITNYWCIENIHKRYMKFSLLRAPKYSKVRWMNGSCFCLKGDSELIHRQHFKTALGQFKPISHLFQLYLGKGEVDMFKWRTIRLSIQLQTHVNIRRGSAIITIFRVFEVVLKFIWNEKMRRKISNKWRGLVNEKVQLCQSYVLINCMIHFYQILFNSILNWIHGNIIKYFPNWKLEWCM